MPAIVAASYKSKHILATWSDHRSLWYLPKGAENLCPHKTCTQMFIAALFIIANIRRQPGCSPVVEWITKPWHIQTVESYPVQKRSKLSSHEKPWRIFKRILVSERSQCEDATHCMSPTTWHSGKGKTTKTMKRSVVPGFVGREAGWRGRVQRILKAVKHGVSCYNDGNPSLHISSNPQKVQHQEWTPMQPLDFGWLGCVRVGSSLGPWFKKKRKKERQHFGEQRSYWGRVRMCGGKEHMEISVPSSQFCFEPYTPL